MSEEIRRYVLEEEALLSYLNRAHDGEDPMLLMFDLWANAKHETIDESDGE
ncbi:hypothetical protein SEA_FORZA_83 [Gordonia phage Forza]|uniref:Uncharacterized protein n=1 Tax=Gordonia phage Forza TaxID=2571247 RepID=A0A650EY45_9CAUD|nr:hypothetical protein PP303_gp083 [Gordonia phage Forza]QEM41552.1 hypothetical protein SEA_BOOPY_83 [Gordonia phage Boopy]QGT55076.1 hypothetical protein SEA_FORZA_83 [Gordonia phage Forza]UXE04226.1 hypothetical protein SEA_BLUENGOLD_82 [Gordonia phage BlueNGold]WBF03865.1 hypothetical protein SEA_MAREELIH_82 [Gordonia phage Mareelih]